MARVCHMNRCPVGVATQREDLRSLEDIWGWRFGLFENLSLLNKGVFFFKRIFIVVLWWIYAVVLITF